MTLQEAHRALVEEEVPAKIVAPSGILIAFSIGPPDSQGIRAATNVCNIVEEPGGYVCIVPFQGLRSFEVRKPLDDLVALVVRLATAYRSEPRSLGEVFVSVVDDPFQFLEADGG